jgi:hypothetical protein
MHDNSVTWSLPYICVLVHVTDIKINHDGQKFHGLNYIFQFLDKNDTRLNKTFHRALRNGVPYASSIQFSPFI